MYIAVLAAIMRLAPADVSAPSVADGCDVYITGKIYQKEIKQNKSIIYLQDAALITASFYPPNVNERSQGGQSLKKQLHIGNIMCYMESDMDIAMLPQMGSVISITGKFRHLKEASNPGEFDAKEYYALIGISGSIQSARLIGIEKGGGRFDDLREALWQLGRKCACVYEECMESKEASVMKAMLLGQKGNMDAELKKLYSSVGIAHILAISGLHISLIGTGIYKLLRKVRLPAPAAACMGILFLVCYVLMTGGSPSSYRAVCMFLFYLFAKAVGRTYDMLTAAAVAAMILLVKQPLYLYHTGFQLSFAAILGIVYLTPLIRKIGEGDRRHNRGRSSQHSRCRAAERIWNAFSVSLGVFLASFPIQLSAYYGICIYSVCLNLFVIPCMSILLCAGGAGLMIGLCNLSAGALCLQVCHYVLVFYEKISSLTLSLPHAIWITGRPQTWQIIGYYGLLLIVLYAVGRKSHVKKRQPIDRKYHVLRYIVLRYVTLSVCIMIAVTVLTYKVNTGGLQITFLDIGQGDAIFIRSETGHTYLIDGGSSSNKKMAEYQLIPYLKYNGIDTIDCAFISHLDEDHYNALLELLTTGRQEGVCVERVMLSDAEIRDDTYEWLCKTAKTAGAQTISMRQGDCVKDGGLVIQCLYPRDDTNVTDRNDASLVLAVRYENFLGIFMGDLGAEREPGITEQIIQMKENESTGDGDARIAYTLLKAAHHGSKYSGSRDFLRGVKPDAVVISCGENNRYGHPHAETLERLADIESDIYITYETGAVTFRVKGGIVYGKTYRASS